MTDRSLSVKQQILILVGLMLATFGFRFLPYYLDSTDTALWAVWNASPVWALFLLAFARCRIPWVGVLIPLSGLIVTDMLLLPVMAAKGIEPGSLTGRLVIYALFIGLSHLGWIVRKWPAGAPGAERFMATIGTGVAGSILFFFITNTMIWFYSVPADGAHYYAPTFSGLLRCYELALPFFRNQFLGDMAFLVGFVFAYAGLERVVLARARARSLAALA